jgi:cytochrome c biogenesis protein CcmG/thiol:disulfide interchange protein DsbE
MILVVFLWQGLSLDPHKLPSALLNKSVPQFKLSTIQGTDQQFTDQNLRGKISLLNVWASWCMSCRDEHSVLMDIARDYQIPIYGVDYKDQRSAAIEWLQQFGDPYKLVGFDGDGSVAIDWGVYGTPETFVIDKAGVIRYKFIGPLTEEAWQEEILPVVKRLQEKS